MQIPSGVIADTLGTRTSIISGNLIAGIGSILFGMATGFEMALAGRFLVGLGVSVVFISIMKNNSVWFHEKVFGIMSGLTRVLGAAWHDRQRRRMSCPGFCSCICRGHQE